MATGDMTSQTQRILTDEMVEQIRSYFPRYPTKQAVTLPALHVVNDALKHVPSQAVIEIAELLELTPADVQDTLTFYGYFRQDQPHGQVRAWVCRSVSCALRDAEKIRDHLCSKLGIAPGETTSDGQITIEEAECLGACDYAPCILANDQLWKNLDQAKADEFLATVTNNQPKTSQADNSQDNGS